MPECRSEKSLARRSLPKGGGQVYIARTCGQSERHRGETMLTSARRSNLFAPQLWKRAVVYAAVFLVGVLWPLASRAQDRAVAYAPADVRYGAQIYAAQCSACHGVNGTQIGGVDLGGGALRRASSDQDLRAVLANGIPGTAMPPFRFDPSEITAIVAYVRNMRNFDTHAANLGDPARGRAWFEGA